MKKNLLVTLADKKYLDFAKSLFSGVYFNSGWQGDYMLLAHEVPEEDLKWFKDKGILIKKCEPLAEKLAGRWPATVLSKLYLFTPEFKQWDKIIYLDADLIVTGSLDNLLKVKKVALLARYLYPFFLRVRLKHLYNFYGVSRQLQQQDAKKYNFNSPTFMTGIMAINTEIIKTETFQDLKTLSTKFQSDIPAGVDFLFSLYFADQAENLSPIYLLSANQLVPYIQPQKLKALTLHFFLYDRPVSYFEFYYKIWKNNFDRASEIDLNNRPPAVLRWNDKEMRRYFFQLRIKLLFLGFKFLVIHSFDHAIGLAGLWLKKYFPPLYKFLIKFKASSRNDDKILINKSSFIIRKYQPGDEQGIIEVFNQVFPSDQMTLEKWRWKYADNPGGFETLVAVNQDNKIVGHFGKLFTSGTSAGQKRRICHVVDACLLLPYRNQKFLRRCFKTYVNDPSLLSWAFGSDTLAPIYKMLALDVNQYQHECVVFKTSVFRKKISGGKFSPFSSAKNQKSNPYVIRQVTDDSIGPKIDQFWELKSPEIHTGVIRNFNYLRWRVINSPEKLKFLLIEAQNKIIGYCAIKTERQTAYINDILILNKYVGPQIFVAIENYCRDIAAKQIIIMATDPALISALKLKKYKIIRQPYFGSLDHNNKITASSFYLTFSDVDFYFGT
ncbi:MAG: glycosyltransferase [Patescibacteria group bacterium]|jgi:lipopolysaccharide biosynthesis glycosyltransferase